MEHHGGQSTSLDLPVSKEKSWLNLPKIKSAVGRLGDEVKIGIVVPTRPWIRETPLALPGCSTKLELGTRICRELCHAGGYTLQHPLPTRCSILYKIPADHHPYLAFTYYAH